MISTRLEGGLAGLVLLFSMAPFALLGTTPEEIDASQHYRLALWCILYILFAALFLLRRLPLLEIMRRHKALLALTALTAVSALWSLAPATTLAGSVALCGTTLIALYLGQTLSPAQMLRSIAASTALLAAGSALAIYLLPDHATMHGTHEGLWNGLTTHKNELGRFMMVGMVSCLALLRLTPALLRPLWLGAALLCAILLAGAQSATAFVLLASFALLYGILRLARSLPAFSRLALLSISLTLGAMALLLLASTPALQDSAFGLLGRDASLTHRTRIWAIAWEAISERPWLGYGYEAFWNSGAGSAFSLRHTSWVVPHVHNGFIEVWLGLGLPGLVLLALTLLALLRHALRPQERTMLVLLCLCLTTSLILNIVEFNFIRYNSFFWLLFVYVLARLETERSTER